MITLLASLLTLLLASASYGFQEPDNFRGVKWDASPEEAKEVIKEQWKKREVEFDRYGFASKPEHFARVRDIEPKTGLYGKGGRGEFLFRDTIGDAIVDIHIWFLENKFVQAELRFKSAFFPILEAAFKDRYGAPTLEEEREVQNRAGAKFTNKQISWIGPNVQIRIEKYFGTITDGRATVSQSAYVEYLLKERKEKLKDAAKNL